VGQGWARYRSPIQIATTTSRPAGEGGLGMRRCVCCYFICLLRSVVCFPAAGVVHWATRGPAHIHGPGPVLQSCDPAILQCGHGSREGPGWPAQVLVTSTLTTFVWLGKAERRVAQRYVCQRRATVIVDCVWPGDGSHQPAGPETRRVRPPSRMTDKDGKMDGSGLLLSLRRIMECRSWWYLLGGGSSWELYMLTLVCFPLPSGC
jgi:hypothetical protein